MTIEEAISFYEESERINKELAEQCESATAKNHNLDNAEKCRQMIAWLRELQERRKEPKIIFCHECKHWKDSDGVYRRGICAESKCPVNSRQVYEGIFFCGMAERRTDGEKQSD